MYMSETTQNFNINYAHICRGKNCNCKLQAFPLAQILVAKSPRSEKTHISCVPYHILPDLPRAFNAPKIPPDDDSAHSMQWIGTVGSHANLLRSHILGIWEDTILVDSHYFIPLYIGQQSIRLCLLTSARACPKSNTSLIISIFCKGKLWLLKKKKREEGLLKHLYTFLRNFAFMYVSILTQKLHIQIQQVVDRYDNMLSICMASVISHYIWRIL